LCLCREKIEKPLRTSPSHKLCNQPLSYHEMMRAFVLIIYIWYTSPHPPPEWNGISLIELQWICMLQRTTKWMENETQTSRWRTLLCKFPVLRDPPAVDVEAYCRSQEAPPSAANRTPSQDVVAGIIWLGGTKSSSVRTPCEDTKVDANLIRVETGMNRNPCRRRTVTSSTPTPQPSHQCGTHQKSNAAW
jgi:hypothetical protein